MAPLAGKVVIVTGASSGIGAATGMVCAQAGARVVLVARRRDRLEKVAESIRRAGGEALVVVMDVTEAKAAEALAQTVVDAWGRIDVLVNNAGRGLLARFEDTTPEELTSLMELNVVSIVRLSQAVLPVMRGQGGGHLINISSVAGRRGAPWRSAYSATKFALGGLSDSLRQELRGTGIRVSVVYPVVVPTEFHDKELCKMPQRIRGPVQSPESVARAIVQCIRHPRAAVYPHGLVHPLAICSMVSPEIVDLLVARLLRPRTPKESRACSTP